MNAFSGYLVENAQTMDMSAISAIDDSLSS